MKLMISVSLLFCINAFAENDVSSVENNCKLSNTWGVSLDEKTMKTLTDKGYVFESNIVASEVFNDPLRLHLGITSDRGDSNLKASYNCGSWNNVDRVDKIKMSILKFDNSNGFTLVGTAYDDMAACSSYSLKEEAQEMNKVLNQIAGQLPACKDL